MRPRFLDSPHSYTRVQRHARGWRDIHGEKPTERIRLSPSLADAVVLTTIVWCAVLAVVMLYLEWK